ncbi:MAG: hypothetical protein AAF243_01760 [Cyanobacteria bacterium P01_A01_bin.137]
MVNRSQPSELGSSERLANIWTARYFSNNSLIYTETANPSSYALEDAASIQGRRSTCRRFSDFLIGQSCKRAAIRTKDLYTHHQDLNLTGVSELAQFASQVYPVLLEFYQNHTPVVVPSQLAKQTIINQPTNVFAIPEITVLADTLRPFLSAFHTQHTLNVDWQTRSFLTTQLSLSNGLLLETLSPAEQVLLAPYFYFLEEYVAIPWQRVCGVATNHEPTSPTFRVAERLLSQVSDISTAVYTQWSTIFGGYYNRRGQLDNPGVKHSTLRDFSMFQVYLWLCVLQGNLEAIEQELVVLSALVYRGIGIPWEMTVRGTKLLGEAILNALNSSEQGIVSPYTEGMVRIFATR